MKTYLAVDRSHNKLKKDFGFNDTSADESSRKQGEDPSRWKRFVHTLTLRHWGFRGEDIKAADLWRLYNEKSWFASRLKRILPLVLIFFVAGYFLMKILGFPFVPARGPYLYWIDWWCFLCPAIFMSLLLTFYVADVTQVTRRFVYYLQGGVTTWPPYAFERLRKRWKVRHQPLSPRQPPFQPPQQIIRWGQPPQQRLGPADDLLIDYLDIDFIAQETEAIGGLIYYPFVIISLMIISRLSIFDYWTWPAQLVLLLGCNAAYAAFSAFYLRRTAENARKRALEQLDDRLVAYTADGYSDSAEAKTVREASAMIRAENRGAFAAISDQPIARALLLPSGSAGLLALVQYFPRFFS